MPANDTRGPAGLIAVAAARMREEGLDSAADALLASHLVVGYGDSWWDGHDDYFYDIHLTLTVPPDLMPRLEQDREALGRILGNLVSFFPDDTGDYRKGVLERLDVTSTTT